MSAMDQNNDSCKILIGHKFVEKWNEIISQDMSAVYRNDSFL